MYKILIVDDEPLTREYLKTHIPFLHPEWQVTLEAMDGKEAWDLLQQRQVDLIITDIKMPIMDGLELCKLINVRFPKQKMIVLSGYDEFAMAKEAMRYGVSNYLLKPIAKEELVEALIQIKAEIDHETSEALTLHTMLNVSEDTKKQVIKNFLKAIVSDSSLELKTLYPLIFRLNVSLIDVEGMLLLLTLDMEQILTKAIPMKDISIFNYILHQVTSEIAEAEDLGTVFLDEHQNTVVLVVGDTEQEIVQKCHMIYERVSSFLKKETGMSITGAIGSTEGDVLQLNGSYHKARKIMHSRFITGGNTLYTYDDNHTALNKIQTLEQAIASIQSGLLDHNEMIYSVSIRHAVETMEPMTRSHVFSFGLYLIEVISQFRRLYGEVSIDLMNRAFDLLITPSNPLIKVDIIALYLKIIKLFDSSHSSNHVNLDESDIVSKVKEYIYAHYSEPLSLALIAEKIDVSSGYLSNIFHKKVNESYIKFLTRVRMEQASKLLKEQPAKKVYEVAEKVGYLSVKHFCYVFKQYFGLPPGEYQDNK